MESMKYRVIFILLFIVVGCAISQGQETDFWVRKMRTFFSRLDFNKDGVLSQNDIESLAEQLLDEQDNEFDKVWDNFLEPFSNGGNVNPDMFIESMRRLVHDLKLQDILESPLPVFFHAIDANDDHMINGDELDNFFGVLKLDTSLAVDTFNAIDMNTDGDISLEEYVRAGLEFFTEEHDESKPSKLFWGPI